MVVRTTHFTLTTLLSRPQHTAALILMTVLSTSITHPLPNSITHPISPPQQQTRHHTGALILMTVLSAAIGNVLPNLLPRKYTHYASAVRACLPHVCVCMGECGCVGKRVRERMCTCTVETEGSPASRCALCCGDMLCSMRVSAAGRWRGCRLGPIDPPHHTTFVPSTPTAVKPAALPVPLSISTTQTTTPHANTTPQLLFLYFGIKLLLEARAMEGDGPSEELEEVEAELIHKKEGKCSTRMCACAGRVGSGRGRVRSRVSAP